MGAPVLLLALALFPVAAAASLEPWVYLLLILGGLVEWTVIEGWCWGVALFSITELNGGGLVLREAEQKQLLSPSGVLSVKRHCRVKPLMLACAGMALHAPQSYRSHMFCLCSSSAGGRWNLVWGLKPYASATESLASFLTQPCSVYLQLEYHTLGGCVLAGDKVVTDKYQELSSSILGMLFLSGMEREVHYSFFTAGHQIFLTLVYLLMERSRDGFWPVHLSLWVVFEHLLSSSHYMVIFPTVIQHSQEEKLCIHLSSLTEAVHMAVTLEVTTQNHTLVEQDVEKPGIFQCITFQASIAVATHLAVDALTFTSDRSPALLWIHCLLLCHGLQAGWVYFPTSAR